MTSGAPHLYERPGLYDAAFGRRLDNEDLKMWTGLLREQEAERVLVAGCGSGRVSESLAEASFDVTGIDLSPAMLRAAGEKHAGLYAAADMTRLPFAKGGFDALIAPSLSFCYLTEDAQIAAALADFRRVCRPGGLIALEVVCTNKPRRLQGVRESATLPGGVFYEFAWQDIDRDLAGRAVIWSTITIRRGDDEAVRHARLTAWTPDGLSNVLAYCRVEGSARDDLRRIVVATT